MFCISTYSFVARVRTSEEDRLTIVGIIRGADVFHFEDIAAFGASCDRAVAGHLLCGEEEGLEVGFIPLGARAIQKTRKDGRGK